MKNSLIARSTIDIAAPCEKVWSTLLNPASLQQVMMGMQPVSDWNIGSTLRWIGRHGGEPNDTAKGTIEVMDANQKLQFTFYFPGYGYPDQEQFYNTVSIALTKTKSGSSVHAEQGDFSVLKDGEQYRQHAQTFWDGALKILKELSEQ